MSRRPLVLLGLVALVISLMAGCSSSNGSSASNDSTTTTDFNQVQQKQNLDQFAKDIESRQSSSVAIASSPPISIWATFLREYDNDQPLTVRHDGENLRICGVGQRSGGCAELSNFTFDGANQVSDLDYEGVPIRTLLSGAGITAEYASGDFASVSLHEAFLDPTSRQLHVSLGLTWDPERFPETGCDPASATYSNGGPVADPRGGGVGDGDVFTSHLMTMSFPDATLGGDLKVSCRGAGGATQIFTFTLFPL